MRRAILLSLCLVGQSLYAQSPQSTTDEPELLRSLEAATSRGGYDAGLALLKDIVAKQPGNLPARFFLATAYQAKGNYAACFSTVQDGVQLKTVDARLLGILWVCQSESGKTDEARITAEQAVANFPGAGESHRWLGLSRLAQKDHPAARAQFQQALRLDHEDATSLYILAQLYRADGLPIPSLFTYLRFLTVEPTGSRAAKARAQLKQLLTASLEFKFADRTHAEVKLSIGNDSPNEEGNFTVAQQALAVYASPTSRLPELTPARLHEALQKVLAALPATPASPSSFTLQTLAPFFQAIPKAGLLEPLAQLALTEPDASSQDVIRLLRWSAEYRWSN